MSNRITTRLLGAVVVVLLGMVMAGCDNRNTATTTEETTTTTVSTETTTTTTDATTTTAQVGVEVPDVTGLNFDEALSALEEAGFEAVISDSYAAGTVADLDTVAGSEPAVGETLDEGARVAVQLYAVPSNDEGEAIASIEEQGHEVITGFLDRANRIDPNVGPVPLKDTDPYGGAVRDALGVTDELIDWAEWCYETDRCGPGDKYDPDYSRFGRIEVLRHVGEGIIHPYGDGTFYVDAVYAATVGDVLNNSYYVGFRFAIEEGRAVLIDAAMNQGDIKKPRPIWMSELEYANPEPVTAESLNSGVTVEVVDTIHRVDFGFHSGLGLGIGDVVTVLEVTNNTDAPVVPWAIGFDVEGFQADEYNRLKAGWEEEGAALSAWNFAYWRSVAPGETATAVVRVRYIDGQVEGEPFQLTVIDAHEAESSETADPLIRLEIELEDSIDRCSTRLLGGDTLGQRQCLEPVGFLDHQWSG